jgi:GNAT superfamily N-acetyltransferase
VIATVDFRIDMSTMLELYDHLEPIVIYDGDLIGYDDDHCPVDVIGHFRLTHITWYDSGVMDDFSGELLHADAAIRSLEGYAAEVPPTAWFLDRLVVLPPYQRHGVASNCLYRLLRHASNVSPIGVFVACTTPVDDDRLPVSEKRGHDSETIKLRKQAMATFYTQLGLKHLPISHPIKALNKVGSEPLWYYHDLACTLPAPPPTWRGDVDTE